MAYSPLKFLLRFGCLLSGCATLAFHPQSSEALVVFGSNDQLAPSNPDYNDTYTLPPNDGAPWAYAARVSPDSPSAVYLGHGFILTANHVATRNTGILIDGQVYDRDQTFERIRITTGSDNVDLSLWKILGDPGLPELPIAIPTVDYDLGTATTLIGWGAGKGQYLSSGYGPNKIEGWEWDQSIQIKRWGTNMSDGEASSLVPGVDYEVLRFFQNRNAGPGEAAPAQDDSGAGAFQLLGGIWKLSGIATLSQSPSLFVNSDTYYSEGVRLGTYSHLLRFENWKVAVGGNSALEDLSDGDNDGIPLLAEYAMGMAPGANSMDQLPSPAIDGDYLTITYRRLMSATDVEFVIEESDTVGGWVPATVAVRETIATDHTIHMLRDKVPIAGATRKFLRVRVTRL